MIKVIKLESPWKGYGVKSGNSFNLVDMHRANFVYFDDIKANRAYIYKNTVSKELGVVDRFILYEILAEIEYSEFLENQVQKIKETMDLL